MASSERAPVWIILDGGKHIATGCVKGEDRAAQQALSTYITAKYRPVRKERDIEVIDVADVLSIYDDDSRDRQVNKAKFDERLDASMIFGVARCSPTLPVRVVARM